MRKTTDIFHSAHSASLLTLPFHSAHSASLLTLPFCSAHSASLLTLPFRSAYEDDPIMIETFLLFYKPC